MFSPIVLVDVVFYPRDFALRAHAYYTTHNTYTHITRRVIHLGRGDCIICFAYYYVIMTTLYVYCMFRLEYYATVDLFL